MRRALRIRHGGSVEKETGRKSRYVERGCKHQMYMDLRQIFRGEVIGGCVAIIHL